MSLTGTEKKGEVMDSIHRAEEVMIAHIKERSTCRAQIYQPTIVDRGTTVVLDANSHCT